MINDTIEQMDALQRLIQSGRASPDQVEEEKKLLEEYKIYRVELFKLIQKIEIFLNRDNDAHAELNKELDAYIRHSDTWRKTKMQSLDAHKRNAFLLQGMQIQRRITEATQRLSAHELKEIL